MTTPSFRDSVNALGWSRRDPDIPATTAPSSSSSSFFSKLQSFNPFGQGEGYLRLPTHEAPGAPLPAANRRDEEEGFFARKHILFGVDFYGCGYGYVVYGVYWMDEWMNGLRTRIGAIHNANPLVYGLHSTVSRWDRMLIFIGCNVGAAVCFFICFFLFPVLSLRPRKFAVLYVSFIPGFT